MDPWDSWKSVTTGASFYFAACLVAIVLFGAAAWLFFRVWTRPSRLRNACRDTLLVALSCALSFLVIEGYFRFVYDECGGISSTLSGMRWFERHWRPVNAGGFRDDEHPAERLAGKRTVFVLGDSFAAGHGIPDYRDTFPLVLGRELGADWEVVALAQCGWNIKEYCDALATYEYQRPEVVVLALFVNDIESSSGTILDKEYRTSVAPDGLTGALVNSSYALSLAYSYWIMPRLVPNYIGILFTQYENKETWEAYTRQLDQFTREVEARGARLIVVPFPLLQDVHSSKVITDKITGFFRGRNVEVLDLVPHLKDMSIVQLCASRLDVHPSELVHKLVADLLKKQILQSVSQP